MAVVARCSPFALLDTLASESSPLLLFGLAIDKTRPTAMNRTTALLPGSREFYPATRYHDLSSTAHFMWSELASHFSA